MEVLPDISKEIALVMKHYAEMVTRSRGRYPSRQEDRILELVDNWLDTQKEEALALCGLLVEDCTSTAEDRLLPV